MSRLRRPSDIARAARALPLVAAVGALALGGATAGCGGGDSTTQSNTAPQTQATATTAATTGTATTTTGGGGGNGNGGTPSGGGGGSGGGAVDRPGHDIPPEPGSPQDKFEKACKANPGMCD